MTMDSVTFNLLVERVKTSNPQRIVNKWESKGIRKERIDIQALREKYGLTPEGLADILGVSAHQLYAWEHGLQEPDRTTRIVLRIAERHPGIFIESLWDY